LPGYYAFRAYIRQASADRLGLKVTLHSGNVASWILPVRIHELDSEDRKLIMVTVCNIVSLRLR